MPQTYKILGQVTPTANVITNIYVTGASTSAVIGTLIIINTSANDQAFQLHVRPVNESLNLKHLLTYHTGVLASNTVIVNGGITMGPNTILAVNATSTSISFQAHGVEIT